MTPIRLQLSRAKGFNLQAASHAANGLPCVSVARPGRYGNYAGPTKADFDEYVASMDQSKSGILMTVASKLRGYNLACWCELDAECHGDTWLELANRP